MPTGVDANKAVAMAGILSRHAQNAQLAQKDLLIVGHMTVIAGEEIRILTNRILKKLVLNNEY